MILLMGLLAFGLDSEPMTMAFERSRLMQAAIIVTGEPNEPRSAPAVAVAKPKQQPDAVRTDELAAAAQRFAGDSKGKGLNVSRMRFVECTPAK